MIRKVYLFVIIIVIVGCFVLVACGDKNESINEQEGNFINAIGDLGTAFDESSMGKSGNEIINYEVAEYISYNYQDRSMYVAGLKVFEEFSTSNEGTVSISTDGNVLTFAMAKATGTVTGAVDGPHVYFQLNLVTNEIIDRIFEPAPNYTELGRLEFAEYSNEVIELSDERILQIGLYFKDLIMGIEAN